MSKLHGQTITDNLREQWLAERQYRIGSSEIASALGVNQYNSQLRLFLTKSGKLPPVAANEAMEIGSVLESAILELYQRRTGAKIQRTQVFHVSPQYDYLCATLDGITDTGINVQTKNVGCDSAIYWGQEGTDDIPHHVIMQVQQEMLCSGLEETNVAALIGGSEFRIYPVSRNEKIIKHIIKLGREFINKVINNIYPEPDYNRDYDLIQYLFSECEGTVEFNERQSADVVKWHRLGADLKQLEIEHKQLKLALVMAMGAASRANLIDGQVLYRSITRVGASVRNIKSYSFPVLRLKESQ